MANFFTRLLNKVVSTFTGTKTPQTDTTYSQEPTDYSSEDEYTWQDEVYIQNINEIIYGIRDMHPNAGSWFDSLLHEQIERYGAQAVSQGLDSFDPAELNDMVAGAFYNPESNSGTKALTELMTAITSEIPTTEDVQSIEDIILNENWTNYTGD